MDGAKSKSWRESKLLSTPTNATSPIMLRVFTVQPSQLSLKPSLSLHCDREGRRRNSNVWETCLALESGSPLMGVVTTEHSSKEGVCSA